MKNSKKLIIRVIVVVVATCVILSSALIVNAETGPLYFMPMAKPQIGDNQVMIELLVQFDYGIAAACIVANIIPDLYDATGTDDYIAVNVNQSRVQLFPSTESTSPYITASILWNTGAVTYYTGEPNSSVIIRIDNGTILGCRVYGDYREWTSIMWGQSFSLLYSESAAAVLLLQQILEQLQIDSNGSVAEAIDRNTDKVIDSFNEEKYDSYNSEGEIMDNYSEAEETALTNAELDYRASADSIFDESLFSSENNSMILGLMSASRIVEVYTEIPQIMAIMKYILAFGIIAFVLGLVILFMRGRRKG